MLQIDSDCLSVKMRKLIFSLWFFDEILMNPIRLLHCTQHFGVKLSFAAHLMWPYVAHFYTVYTFDLQSGQSEVV